MTKEEIIAVFKDKGVMLEGHFLLTSGRHSDRYMQCAKLFQYPKISEAVCANLAEKMAGFGADVVVGPAIGGIILAYEMSRQLGARNIFAEREDGKMTLRRGFTVQLGERAIVTEDVVTTGGSVKEVIELLNGLGVQTLAVGCIVDRSEGAVDFGIPLFSVLSMKIESYEPGDCPICQTGIPAVKPGSRSFK